MRQLWTTPIVSFQGRFDRIDRAGINPRPRRQIPIWLGGHSEAAYERGAKFGDGFIYAAPGAGAVEAWNSTRRYLQAAGRPEDGFGRELLTLFATDAQEAADHLKIWQDAGGTHGCVQSMDKVLGPDIDAHIDYLAKVKQLLDAG